MKQRPEVVISFSDIAYGVLRRWRLLIILTAVCALLAGSYSYVSAKKDSTAALQAVDLSTLEDTDADCVTDAVRLHNLYDTMLTEYDKDYITGLDENKVFLTTLVYYVEGPDGEEGYDYAQDLVKAYAALAVGDSVREAYLTANPDSGISMEDLHYLLSAETDGHTLTVVTRGADEKVSKALAELVTAAVDAAKESLTEMIGEHTLTLTARTTTVGADVIITEAKLTKKTAVETARTDAEDAYDHLDSELQSRVDALLAQQEGSLVTAASVSKKMVIVGALVGLVLAVLLALCGYVWSRKINNPAELEQVYDLNIFGKLPATGKTALKGPDAAIARGQYGLAKDLKPETELSLSLSRIAGKAEAEKLSTIGFAGVGIDSEKEAFSEVLPKELSSCTKDCQGIWIDSSDRGEEFRALSACQAIVPVLRLGFTRRSELEELLKICAEQNISVMGIIIIV